MFIRESYQAVSVHKGIVPFVRYLYDVYRPRDLRGLEDRCLNYIIYLFYYFSMLHLCTTGNYNPIFPYGHIFIGQIISTVYNLFAVGRAIFPYDHIFIVQIISTVYNLFAVGRAIFSAWHVQKTTPCLNDNFSVMECLIS